jgi:hypothetical protein
LARRNPDPAHHPDFAVALTLIDERAGPIAMTFEIEQPVDADHSPVVEPTKPRLLGVLGPGLITGASDDDPSGIATYS